MCVCVVVLCTLSLSLTCSLSFLFSFTFAFPFFFSLIFLFLSSFSFSFSLAPSLTQDLARVLSLFLLYSLLATKHYGKNRSTNTAANIEAFECDLAQGRCTAVGSLPSPPSSDLSVPESKKNEENFLLQKFFRRGNYLTLQFYINSEKSPPGEITVITVFLKKYENNKSTPRQIWADFSKDGRLEEACLSHQNYLFRRLAEAMLRAVPTFETGSR